MKPDNEFERLALPPRRELVACCHRMTGSADEAGDLAREALPARLAVQRHARGPLVAANLAVPDRHPRLPGSHRAARPVAGPATRD